MQIVLRQIFYAISSLSWLMFSRSSVVNLGYLLEGTCFEDPMICDSSVFCRCSFLCLNEKSSTASLNFLVILHNQGSL